MIKPATTAAVTGIPIKIIRTELCGLELAGITQILEPLSCCKRKLSTAVKVVAVFKCYAFYTVRNSKGKEFCTIVKSSIPYLFNAIG